MFPIMISNLAGWGRRLDGFLMVFYISLEYTTEKVTVFTETNMGRPKSAATQIVTVYM